MRPLKVGIIAGLIALALLSAAIMAFGRPGAGPLAQDPGAETLTSSGPVEAGQPFAYFAMALTNPTSSPWTIEAVRPDAEGAVVMGAYLTPPGQRGTGSLQLLSLTPTEGWSALPATLGPGEAAGTVLVMQLAGPGTFRSDGVWIDYIAGGQHYSALYKNLRFMVCSTPAGCG